MPLNHIDVLKAALFDQVSAKSACKEFANDDNERNILLYSPQHIFYYTDKNCNPDSTSCSTPIKKILQPVYQFVISSTVDTGIYILWKKKKELKGSIYTVVM